MYFIRYILFLRRVQRKNERKNRALRNWVNFFTRASSKVKILEKKRRNINVEH